ncbi:uncharacterized protein [Acropora muricata]|uniref:uncharacterized protein n=1 Tax=Acropora muricata TaxID=159855 RepID=UPI0034E4D3A8
MGSGASRNLHAAESQAIDLTPFSSHQEYPTDITLQPRIPQEQWLSHDMEHETNKEISYEGNIERDMSHADTLTRYKMNHPKQAEDFQTMFENMQVLRNTMNNNSKRRDLYSKLVGETINSLNYKIYSISEWSHMATDFALAVDFAVEIEGAELLQRFAQSYFNGYYEMGGEQDDDESSSEDESWDLTCFDFLQLVLATIQNFADFHDGFCLASAQAGVVSMCLENIIRLDRENGNWQSGDEESEPIKLISNCLSILHNISRRLRDRELFANSEKTLLYFAKVKNRGVAVTALLCLAYLVNEDTNHLISADENLLGFLIIMLNAAYQSEDRRCIGFSAKELAEGLSHLAINDNNKKILGQNGAIRVLTATLQTSNDDGETASGARALWMLAFDDTNKDEIIQQEGTLDTLRALHNSANPEVQKAAAGALWEIEGKTARGNVDKTKETTGNHVMISYQWDAQQVLVEVKNKLQASGYRVWMDLEQMGGSTLDAMAKGVENAAVVLVCVSQRYKESPNCRSEAEYAYQLRKDIIPLIMQRNYKADGWLGMLVGTKLWIGFQSKQVIDSGVGKLIKELRGRGKDVDTTDGPGGELIQPIEASLVTALSEQSMTNVSNWTNEDVKKWLTEIGLKHVCQEDISEFNGQTLIDLHELRRECPDYFYKCLEHTLNLKNMFHLLKFRKELDKLLSH